MGPSHLTLSDPERQIQGHTDSKSYIPERSRVKPYVTIKH